MKVQIESRLINEMSQNLILPAVIEYQNKLIQNVKGLMDVLGSKDGKEAAKTQVDLISRISGHLNRMTELNEKMLNARKSANKIEDYHKRAASYCDTVKIFFDEIRYHADKLEMLVDDELWPLPKFREMLFTK